MGKLFSFTFHGNNILGYLTRGIVFVSSTIIMRKTLFVLFALTVLIISAAFTTFDPPKYKNLKILPKDISEKAMDSIMQHYSISLGVTCNFCHVHNTLRDTWDMASDANHHKIISRKMMLMTDGINAKYFPSEKGAKDEQPIQTITCFTCHKGEVIPVDMPEITPKK